MKGKAFYYQNTILMKRYIVLLLLLLSLITKGQNWTSLNGGTSYPVLSIFGDTINNKLYAAGLFDTIGGISANRIARWNGNSWDSMSAGFLNVLLIRHAFTLYNGNLVTANNVFNFSRAHIAKWDGVQWDSIGNNFICKPWDNFVGVITLNNELYAYGVFDSINHIYYNSIAKWDGQNWISLGFPYRFTGDTPSILCLAMYNNELYAAGAFSDSNNQMVNIAKYDGNSWSIVGGGFHGPMDQVYDLEVYQNELYAAGEFKISDGNAFNYIARWNGTEWKDVGGGVTSADNSQINDLLVLNNKLYAGGVFTEVGGIPATYLAAWNGTNWCGFGNTESNSTTVGCMATINNDLYITCNNMFAGVTVNRIAKWIGGNYVDTCGNTTGIKETIVNENELTVYPNPANNQITVEFEIAEKEALMEIKNILGQTVYSELSKTDKGKNSVIIDISAFPNGAYFIQAQSSNSIFSKKFVKQ